MDPPGDPSILILTGSPGTGKTTAARLIAARSNRGVHLETDSFFESIRSGSIEPWKPEAQEQNEVVMGIVADAAAGYARAGYFTVIDGIVLPNWFLEPLRRGLHEAGQGVTYGVLRAPLSTCIQRATERERAPVDAAIVEKLWREFSDLGELEKNAFELEEETPDAVADMLLRDLGRLAV